MITVGSAEGEQQSLDALLRSEVRQPVGAFWRCLQPALVLGRGQKADSSQRTRAAAAGLDVTRRLTGGGAVLAGRWMLSQFVVLPPRHPLARMSLPESFEIVGEAWRRALADHGVAASMVAREGLKERAAAFRASAAGWVCFAGHSYGELTDPRGAKLLGLAQVRRKTGVAVVAGLLMQQPPWELLVDVWLGRRDAELVRELAATTAALSGIDGPETRPGPAAVAASVAAQMDGLGIDWSRGGATPA